MKFFVSQLSFLLRERQTRRNLAGLLKYLLFLTGVVVVFAILFHVIMEYEGRHYSWVTGFYWTLTVMSTLGFGDITFESDLGRAFSMFVLLAGIILLLIVLPFAFIRFFYAPWLEAQIRTRAPRTIPLNVSDHVLICRYDTVARGLAERFGLLDIPFFVIEPDPAVAADLHVEGIPVISGELDAATTYAAAGVDRARAVFANLDDPVNTNITLTVREKSATVPIYATAEDLDSVDLLELAGASQVLPLKQRLGEQLANRVSSRRGETHVVGRFKNLLVAEFPVHNTALVGCTIREAGLRDALGVNVVAVWERGRLIPAHPNTELHDSSMPIVVGTEEQMVELNRLMESRDVDEKPVVVLGGGKVGRAATVALKQKGVRVHLVEHLPEVAAKSEDLVDRVIVGEAADRSALERADLAAAGSVVITTNDDAVNIYLCIYCRRLNPELRIVSRITHERNIEAVHRAGADFALTFASLGRESVLALVQNRELVFLGEGVGFYSFQVPHTLIGHTLLNSGIGARSGLNVIAIEQNGRILSNPKADTQLARGSQIFAIGTSEQRRRFHELFV